MRELARKPSGSATWTQSRSLMPPRRVAEIENDHIPHGGLPADGFARDFTGIPTHGGPSIRVQPKLEVSATNDPAEHEADRVADEVMRMPDATVGVGNQMDREFRAFARPVGLQTKSVSSGDGGVIDAPPAVHDVLNSPGHALDPATRAFFEPRFGQDFSGVRVHRDTEASDVAQALGARAFAAGQHVVLADRYTGSGGNSGRRLLAHELAHVVQQQGAGAARVQCDKDNEAAVKTVKSPTVNAASESADSSQKQLDKRVAKRASEIKSMLDDLGPNPKAQSAKDRRAALEQDLAKSLDEIIATADSKAVNAALRSDIIESSKALGKSKTRLDAVKSEWSKYDATFAGDPVAKALGADSLSPAELKALVAQESGDLMEDDQEGDIAGIAQMGTAEEKRAGGKPDDRKDPQKAILLAAKLTALNAAALDAALSVAPRTGLDRKKFIMAAYNGGVNLVVQAQKEAVAMKLSGTTWASLRNGGKDSPLYKAIVKTYKSSKVDSKFAEVTGYIDKIYARLP